MNSLKWRRDLFQPEKRVNFTELNEKWDIAEEQFVDVLIPVFNQVIDRLINDIRILLEKEDYTALKEIKVGYKDKLVNAIKQQLYDAYLIGRKGVYKEFSIDKELKMSNITKEYFNLKAEIITISILDKIKERTLFIVISGINSGKKIDEIVFDVKGKLNQ